MKQLRSAAFLALGAVLCAFTVDSEVTDYLHTGEKITFNDTEYTLAWSSHPEEIYFKQEYLPEGRTLDDFNDMLIIDAIKGEIAPRDALDLKVAELAELKKTNPVINWNVYENGEEMLLDFVITDGSTVFEWNLYRYTLQKEKKNTYLVLAAYSYRDEVISKEDLKTFFNRILENRNNYIKQLGDLDLPTIKTD